MNNATQSTAANPGKGGKLRPRKIDWRTFSENWDNIFRKPIQQEKQCCGKSCGCHNKTDDIIQKQI